MQKTVAIIVAVLVVLGAGWFLFSTYLVSKLDGTGGVTAPQEQDPLVLYDLSQLGLVFKFPESRYTISQYQNGTAERHWYTVTLVPSNFVPVEGGEGPPSISVGIFPNPEKLPLPQWIKSDARSNWKLAADDAKMSSTTVGGEEALFYQHSGLYETDAIAVAHGDQIFLFETGWMTPTDRIRNDLANLLLTVQFN